MTREAVETLQNQIQQAKLRIENSNRRIIELHRDIGNETEAIASNERKISGLQIALQALDRDRREQLWCSPQAG